MLIGPSSNASTIPGLLVDLTMNVAYSKDMAAQAWQLQSAQPPVSGQPSLPSPAGVSHAASSSSSTNPVFQPVSGYAPLHAPSYTGPRWQTAVPISQTGFSPLQGPPGPPGLPLPSGPWISIRPSGSPPAPQDSPSGNAPSPASAVSSKPAELPISVESEPALTTSSTASVSPSVSQIPVSLSSTPSIPGPPGLSGNSSEGAPAATGYEMPGSAVPPTISESSAPPGVSTVQASESSSTVQGSPTMNNSSVMGSVPLGPVATSFSPCVPFGQKTSSDTPVQSLRPTLSPLGTAPSTVSISPVSQPPLYTPYINVPPVPAPISQWTFQPQAGIQVRARPMQTFVPHPYLPPIRPVVPLQVGAGVGPASLSTDATVMLTPPGEHHVSSKASLSNEGGKLAAASSQLLGQINGHGTLTTSIQNSSLETASSLAESAVDEVADAWSAHKTSEGIVYYYNSITGQSTYEKPLGFRGEVDKVTAQPTPVSCEPIGGTGWSVVITNDAKKYYYHTVTRATSWQVPPEVADYRKRLAEETSTKSGFMQSAKANSDKDTVCFSLSGPAVGGSMVREGQKVNAQAASSSALDLIKKKLQDSATPGVDSTDGSSNRHQEGEGTKEKGKDNNTEKSSSDSSSDSDDEDQGPTKDECVAHFKEMLKEKGIVPFSKWEKELPKIIFDPRFKAIQSHTERRAIFEHYVRTRAEEERKEKRAAQRAAVEGFKQLLEEASKDFNHNTDYEKFSRVWEADSRFQALERKDKENFLNERILPLRKAEEERVRAIHTAAVTGFKTMLKELGEVTSSSRWSKVKDKLRNDPRYRTVRREERESLFNSYVNELLAEQHEIERAAKAKREEEEKLKEREREMRKRKEREEQEMERVRSKARKRDATTSYQALLTEKIKDPEASWTESRPKLEKDPLGRATNPELDINERERLFRKHVSSLYDRCAHEYMALLAEVISAESASKATEEGKTLLSSWSEAKKNLKADPRYGKMPRRDRESLWRRHVEDVQRKSRTISNSARDEKQSGMETGKSASLDGSRRTSSHR